jgi:SAM-dependent methyltransferase
MKATGWMPRFVCTVCDAPLTAGADAFVCPRCAARFPQRNGIWRFLEGSRAQALQPFIRQYRSVRSRDGYGSDAASYYRALPDVPDDDPQAAVWRIRRQSFATLRRRIAEQWGARRLDVIDLGAGNGWLSYRLQQDGHRAAAVDCLDDERDGLGATRHYDAPPLAVQADFDALPFAASQFDLAVFNGSLHYSSDIVATLRHARRVLRSGGAMAVIDSPFFARAGDGRLMLEEKTDRFLADYGLPAVVQHGAGFVTFGELERAASALHLIGRFYRSPGPLTWRVRRAVGGLRRRRSPAAFGVWVAR